MSRWEELFESHPFRAQWNAIREELATESIDDESLPGAVAELARLKKVVAYVDGLLIGLDPELIPVSTWDLFYKQSALLLEQLRAYHQSRNIQHLQNANANADNLLAYVRPYMAAIGRVAKAMREAARAYAGTFEGMVRQYGEAARARLNELEQDEASGKRIAEELSNSKRLVEAVELELLGEDGESGKFAELRRRLNDSEEMHQSIFGFYKRLLVGDEDQEDVSIKEAVLEAEKSIAQSKESAVKASAQTAAVISKLNEFYGKVFGLVAEDGVRTGGLDAEIDAKLARLSEIERDQGNRFGALNSQIESLLPGATSAGLASAYNKLKTSFDSPIKFSERVFYGAIAFLVIVSALQAIQTFHVWPFEIVFVRHSTWPALWQSLLNKLPFYGPVLWLAYYATKRRSEYQRLQQEYAHKEALANSYHSFKKQVEELGGGHDEMLRGLLQKAIDAISQNASTTLDGNHGDKMPIGDAIELAIKEAVKAKTGV